MHLGAFAELVKVCNENLAEVIDSETLSKSGSSIDPTSRRFDWQFQRITRAALGTKFPDGRKIMPAIGRVTLNPEFDKHPGKSGETYLKVKLLHICRLAWKENRNVDAPKWMKNSNTPFENFLVRALEIAGFGSDKDLKNLSTAYNKKYPELSDES